MLIVTLSDEVAERVRERARSQQRSPEEIVAECVERSFPPPRDTNKAQLLADILASHAEQAAEGVWITDEFIRWARDEGRP